MARLTSSDGDVPEITRVWGLRPAMGKAVGDLSAAVYERQRASRAGCARRCACASRRSTTAISDWGGGFRSWRNKGSTRSCTRTSPSTATPSTRRPEQVAIEYAEKFALDHLSIDDAFFARLQEHFTDADILDLTICIGDFMALRPSDPGSASRCLCEV